jgi:hypothetical protein
MEAEEVLPRRDRIDILRSGCRGCRQRRKEEAGSGWAKHRGTA